MVTLELLDCLEKELGRLFSGMLFPKTTGEEIPIQIFKQDFPLYFFLAGGEKSEEDIFPYCVIRAAKGEIAGNPQRVTTILEFGLYNKGDRNDGEIRILNLIERIGQRFMVDNTLAGVYILDKDTPIRWELNEENSYPYYFGLMQMVWKRPSAMRKEDHYA